MKLHTLLVPHVIPRRFRKRCHKSEAEEMQPEDQQPKANRYLESKAEDRRACSLESTAQRPKPKA